jgi:L-ascorbate metabolism protein UlaG (beta-lactamase superfamily)
MKPGIKFKDLPAIDAIVISHNHSDHTDTKTLTKLAKKYDPVVYVPEGNKQLFESMGFSSVIEKTWWEKECLVAKDGTRNVCITCLPAYHWSIRFSLGSYRKSLWSGWMISANDHHIYFAGDTAYGKHFKQIAHEFPHITVALMPIAPTCKGENTHKEMHIDAPEAVDAFIDLGRPDYFLPIHYVTFFKGPETTTYPIARLQQSWDEQRDALGSSRLLFAQCGKPYGLDAMKDAAATA